MFDVLLFELVRNLADMYYEGKVQDSLVQAPNHESGIKGSV